MCKIISVMVLCVIGDYTPLTAFIQAFADALVDIGRLKSTVTISKGCVIHWRYSEDEIFNDINTPGSNIITKSLQCSNTAAYLEISETLLEFATSSARISIKSIYVGGLIYDQNVNQLNAKRICQDTDFSSLRLHSLQLQNYFVQEGRLQNLMQCATEDSVLT
ncbi:hypothetical protein THRCLA_10368 [Thraustotheca clavata]|uniref:Uncharacterized protein n=1 Tax=Thraustotheca clavata TaxID=74557 RepID=A0A1V9YRU6_9STRA|nr:hypothetical protein THRCLA_10368 [Thraustotheca clavata]